MVCAITKNWISPAYQKKKRAFALCVVAAIFINNENELCNACGMPIEGGVRVDNLYRIDNVSTQRVTRITCDEERMRLGYEMQTTLQFAQADGQLRVVTSEILGADEEPLLVQYAPTATVWRMNLGWRRRKEGIYLWL